MHVLVWPTKKMVLKFLHKRRKWFQVKFILYPVYLFYLISFHTEGVILQTQYMLVHILKVLIGNFMMVTILWTLQTLGQLVTQVGSQCAKWPKLIFRNEDWGF